jgi:FkbM family methyltransferase
MSNTSPSSPAVEEWSHTTTGRDIYYWTGILQLNTSFSNGSASPLGRDLSALLDVQIVPCLPLAALVPLDRKIDLIKIDIEGAEYLALSGASEIIARWHPVILSEFSPAVPADFPGKSLR